MEPSCSSTLTASRRSTTPLGIRPVTPCCARPPHAERARAEHRHRGPLGRQRLRRPSRVDDVDGVPRVMRAIRHGSTSASWWGVPRPGRRIGRRGELRRRRARRGRIASPGRSRHVRRQASTGGNGSASGRLGGEWRLRRALVTEAEAETRGIARSLAHRSVRLAAQVPVERGGLRASFTRSGGGSVACLPGTAGAGETVGDRGAHREAGSRCGRKSPLVLRTTREALLCDRRSRLGTLPARLPMLTRWPEKERLQRCQAESFAKADSAAPHCGAAMAAPHLVSLT